MAEPTSTAKNDQNKQVIRIWDDPESRINFMESVLKNKEWEAVIYHPDYNEDGSQKEGGSTPLPELSKKLTARGFKTQMGEDENGIPTLSVKNFGADSKLSSAVKEMGFAKGMTHKLVNIGEPLGNAIEKSTQMIKHVATDNARLIGGIYMLGDVFLSFAGLGNSNKSDDTADEANLAPSGGALSKLSDPANLLQSAAGVAAVVQSLIYMGFAKEGSETVYKDLMNHADGAIDSGKNLLDAEGWKPQEEKSKKIHHLPQRMLEKYPIQLGALTQVGGQLALLTSGGINLKRLNGAEVKDKKKIMGAKQDIVTAITSITGWSILTKKKSEDIPEADKHEWSDPRRLWQEVSESPNKVASGFLSTATISGILAGALKKNYIQASGNVTYLLGDGIMFATDSNDYGAEGAGNTQMLSNAAEQFVQASPMILGEKEQGQMVTQLSRHLAERTMHQEAKKTKTEVSEEKIDSLSECIAAELTVKLPKVNRRANDAAQSIARVVEVFDPKDADSISDALCEKVCELNGVMIEKDELKSHVDRQIGTPKAGNPRATTMERLARPLADLVFAVPGGANPATVNKLYDAIGKHLGNEAGKGHEMLADAINETAERDVRNAMGQPVVGAHSAAILARNAVPNESVLSR
ncbi:MAG: hypothetical protein MK052_06700 [Alphaproteobacteria bacterium]|nr:hypothetical protein [Alphaproteobacteria bacterium]